MRSIFKLSLLPFLLFLSINCFAQEDDVDVDALKRIVHYAKEDSTKLRTLVLLSREFEVTSLAKYEDTAALIVGRLLSKNFYDSSQVLLKHAEILVNIGNCYKQSGNIVKARDCFMYSLKIQQEVNDSAGLSDSYLGLGSTCTNQGDFQNALDYYHKGLNICKAIRDKKREAVILSYFGGLYQIQDDFKKAIDYYEQSMSLFKSINDIDGIGDLLNNISTIYVEEANALKNTTGSSGRLQIEALLARALANNYKAIEIQEKLDDPLGLSVSHANIGTIYFDQEDLINAEQYFKKSLAITKDIDDKQGQSNLYFQIACIDYKQKDFNEALRYSDSSLTLAYHLGYPENIRNAEEMLSKLSAQNGDYKSAYGHYQQFIQYRDSIAKNEVDQDAIQEKFKDEYAKKEASAKLEQQKKDIATAEQDKRQNLILYASLAVLVIVIIFSIFLFNRVKETRRQNKIIEIQKLEVEEQKNVVEEKQKEIVDSIHYAKRIQHALLASDDLLKENLPEYFVFLKPKDIVSGDFYWAQPSGNKFLLGACDCTGHGVPGAFMSLLNISFLNESVIGKKIIRPDLILNQQRDSIIKSLNPTGSEESKDGMDCAICSFDLKNNSIEFACSNNPVWIVTKENGQTVSLKEFAPDKMPVGKYDYKNEPFTHQTAQLKKGDIVYMFTDGYADQFGGEKGKKFKYKKLQELLMSFHHQPLAEQKNILEKTIDDWKGDLEQVDDILVIGVRI